MALEGLAGVCGRIKREKRVRARERENERENERETKAEAGEAACARVGMALALF